MKSLSLASNKVLYRGAKISNKEINQLENYMKKKINNLPSSIVFSKSFLSFSKDRKVAEFFLNFGNIDKYTSKVLFILENDNSLDYNLCTHGDIEEISFLPSEKEVLFFPFSSFEIKEIKEILKGKQYEIKLLYLGKYLNDIKNDNKLIINGKKIPDCEFKKQLIGSRLISTKKINNINLKKLYNFYEKYENEIKDNEIKKREIKNEVDKIKENTKYNNKNESEDKKIKDFHQNFNFQNNKIEFKNDFPFLVYIFGVLNIDKEDLQKEIQIINSYENAKYKDEGHYHEYKGGDAEVGSYSNWDDDDAQNENEITNNIEIQLNGKKIDFSYYHKFEKEGKYHIVYILKKDIKRINHMFYNCSKLITLDFYFQFHIVENMREMFYGCKSLIKIKFSNIIFQKNIDMKNMFFGCNSLKKENIITEDKNILNAFIEQTDENCEKIII